MEKFDCKEFENQIPRFLDFTMNFRTMQTFLAHWEHCAACKEELEIQFLVREGIHHLESGDTFDLQNELQWHLREADRRIKRHRRLVKLGVFVQIAIVLALVAGVLWLVLF